MLGFAKRWNSLASTLAHFIFSTSFFQIGGIKKKWSGGIKNELNRGDSPCSRMKTLRNIQLFNDGPLPLVNWLFIQSQKKREGTFWTQDGGGTGLRDRAILLCERSKFYGAGFSFWLFGGQTYYPACPVSPIIERALLWVIHAGHHPADGLNAFDPCTKGDICYYLVFWEVQKHPKNDISGCQIMTYHSHMAWF